MRDWEAPLCLDTGMKMPGDGRVMRRLGTFVKPHAIEMTTRVSTIASDIDTWQQDDSDAHEASAGVDAARLQAEGWHLMEDRDVENPWVDSQPSQVQVLTPQPLREIPCSPAALSSLERPRIVATDLAV